MVREAEANAEQDKINRERVEAINQAEGILHDTESKMDEFKDQLPSEDVAKMKEKVQEVRDKSEESIYRLLDEVNSKVTADGDTAGQFKLIVSPRLGRSHQHQEQYAFFYRLTVRQELKTLILISELRELTCSTVRFILTRPRTPSSENLLL